jgi:hypothetical protein
VTERDKEGYVEKVKKKEIEREDEAKRVPRMSCGRGRGKGRIRKIRKRRKLLSMS